MFVDAAAILSKLDKKIKKNKSISLELLSESFC